MPLIVQKYGGSSVASLDLINNVADKILQSKNSGNKVVVVVSAMHGETDKLLKLAKAAYETQFNREYAMIATTGEQISAALLALTLLKKGAKAKSLTGWMINLTTDDDHESASIESVDANYLKQILDTDTIPIVTGFQGISKALDITTLGRGGSDVTAVALAAAINANECEIYTDVDGIYTADPTLIKNAIKLDKINSCHMLELAKHGAKVLQKQSVEFAENKNVHLRVLSTFKADSVGTLLNPHPTNEQTHQVIGIATKTEFLFEVKNNLKIDLIGKILSKFHDYEYDILLAAGENIVFTTSKAIALQAQAELNKNSHNKTDLELISKVEVAKISIIGELLEEIFDDIENCIKASGIKSYHVFYDANRITILCEPDKLPEYTQIFHDLLINKFNRC